MTREAAIREAAYACLLEQKWRLLPVEPAQFILENWTILSYRIYAQLAGIPEDAVTAGYFEQDGYTVGGLRENRLLLLYNEQMLPARVRFTIAHELGHFFAPSCKNRGAPITLEEYHAREREADAFAAALLMPDGLLWAMKERGFPFRQEALVRRFGVSAAAARQKLRRLRAEGSSSGERDARLEVLFEQELRRVETENAYGGASLQWEEERAAFLDRQDRMLDPPNR